MVQILKPDIQVRQFFWSETIENYRLNGVVSEVHLRDIWKQMQRVWRPAIWYLLEEQRIQRRGRTTPDSVLAAVTLGAGIDQLLGELENRNGLLDAYAVDCLSMEAMRCFYGVLEKELQRQGFYISRYHFADPDEEGGENIRSLLDLLQTDISLSPEGMMRPCKSVVYRGFLTEEKAENCELICSSCENLNCQRRRLRSRENYREPGVLKYSYGYQRIFGKK